MGGDDDKKKEAAIGIEFFKELTVALIEHRQAIALQTNQIAESMAVQIAHIEAVQELDHHITGASFMLSRMNFVFDKMLEVQKGYPEADPPVEPRVPELSDIAAALVEFDEDAEKAAEEAEKEEKEMEAEEEPEKPSMISSAPKPPPPAKLHPMRPPLPKAEHIKK